MRDQVRPMPVRRFRTLFIVGVLAALAGATLPAAVLAGDTPPPDERIYAFVNGRDTIAVRPDGTDLRTLDCAGDRTYGGAPRRVLRLELTGQTFQGFEQGTQGPIWWSNNISVVVATDETCGDRTVLWAPGAGYELTTAMWSMDGRRVAVSGHHFDASGQLVEQGIWVGELGGSCGSPLCGMHLAVALPMVAGSTSDAGLVAYYRINVTPKWSSDDHRVVYARTMDAATPTGRGAIYVADLGQPGDSAVRSDTRVAVPGTASPFYPAFSPVEGSDQIAYGQTTSTKGCTRNDIFVTTSAGGSARQVTTTKTTTICQIMQPEWSPDARSIAFVGAAGMGPNGLYRIAADGRSKAVLVAGSKTVSYYTPRWRR
jgi:hypothetical protein